MVRVENDDDVRDAVVADFVDEMEKITIRTPVQEAEENEMEVNEVTVLCSQSRAMG